MRVLIIPSADITMSTITRCRSVIESLLDYSHPVAVVCTSSIESWFNSIDIPIFYRPEPDFNAIVTDATIPVRNLTNYVKLIGLADPIFVAESVEAEIQAIQAFKPDIVFSDFDLTAPISAKACSLPLASTANSPFHPTFTSSLARPLRKTNELIQPFNEVLLKNGLELVKTLEELCFLRSDIKIVPSASELEPFMKDVPGTYFVGPLISKILEEQDIPEWLEELDESHPLVFVYLSVGDIGPAEIIDIIPKAFNETEFNVIVSFGHYPGLSDFPRSTHNVRFEKFVPGVAMLRKSGVFIFHGGQNTTVNAVQYEVPSIVFPCLVFERNFNARMIKSIGAGVRLKHSQFRPEILRQTARNLVHQGLSEKAQAIARSLKSLGGAERVVEILESALKQ